MNLERNFEEILFASAMILGWGLFAIANPQEIEIPTIVSVGFIMIAIGNLGYGYINYRDGKHQLIDSLSHFTFAVGLSIMSAAGISIIPMSEAFYASVVLLGVGSILMIYRMHTQDPNKNTF